MESATDLFIACLSAGEFHGPLDSFFLLYSFFLYLSYPILSQDLYLLRDINSDVDSYCSEETTLSAAFMNVIRMITTGGSSCMRYLFIENKLVLS
jgi:hypothetical protein